MIVIPGVGVGAVRFGMTGPQVTSVVAGRCCRREVLDDDRTALWFDVEPNAVVVAPGVGVVGITIARPPAEVKGTDLFALTLGGLRAFFVEREITTNERFDVGDDPAVESPTWIEVPRLGLTLYVDGDRVESVEVVLPSEPRSS